MFRLVWRDLWHERALSLCAAFTVAAAVAPIWTLWGLQQGIVGTMLQRQSLDPQMRLIKPTTSNGREFDSAWFDRVSKWPGVSVVIPDVRRIAANVLVFSQADAPPAMLELLPTAVRDPLLGSASAPTGGQIVLSARAAAALRVAVNDTVRISLERVREGRNEAAAVSLRVTAVLGPTSLSGLSALAPQKLLEDIESWREQHAVEGYAGGGTPALVQPRSWALFRLFADSIHDVADIQTRLEAEDISTRDENSREIARVLGLQRNLRHLVVLVAAVTLSGSIFALTALQVANMRRKRREYALLTLTGHGRAWLIALPSAQAWVIALIGTAAAYLMYLGASAGVERQFADQLQDQETAAHLDAWDIACGALGAMVLSVLPAAWGGWRISNQEAADELREL